MQIPTPHRLPLPTLLLGFLAGLAACLAMPAGSSAAGFGLFQHGGRGAGQAGAMVARADDPSALSMNPAGLAGQVADGVRFRVQAGIDFTAPRDDFRDGFGNDYAAQHQINPPPAFYVLWAPGASERLTLGVGLDSPFWANTEWLPALFPLRNVNSRTQILLFELHPAVAWDLGSGWSLGGGARYVFGSMEVARDLVFSGGSGTVTVDWQADANVDGVGFDLGVRRTAERFGFGATVRSAVEVTGGASASGGIPGPDSLSFELPTEVRFGAWRGFGSKVKVELDVAWQLWSSVDNQVPILPLCLPTCSAGVRPRDWDDTFSIRSGVEVAVSERLAVYGGLGLEPSPVTNDSLEPGFPRGDARVLAAGIGYEIPSARIRFDLGYSLHQHDDTTYRPDVTFTPGLPFPIPVNGTFSGREQVFSFSIRRDF
jgi:long-chain fatty acid transport protein